MAGHPTLGVLLHKHQPFCVTLEREWLNNRRGESCIPIGHYHGVRCRTSPDYDFKDSPKFGDTFQVYGVDGRKNILFHKGNIEEDTHGCIIVGESFGYLGGNQAVLSSGTAFEEFMEILEDEDEFHLAITDNFTGSPIPGRH